MIPQFLGRPTFIEQVEHLAHQAGAEFHEIVLLDTKQNTLRRFAERSRMPADPAHPQAQELLDRSGGEAELSAMYDRLIQVIATRPTVKVIPTHAGQIEQSYHDLLNSLTVTTGA